MAIEVPRHLLTYDDYAALPDDGKRYELIDGEIVMSPSPTVRHQMLRDRLCYHLLGYLERHPGGLAIGDIDTYLTLHTTIRPDFAFYSQKRLGVLGDKRSEAAPDLAIEVLSPGNRHIDLGRKLVLYSEHGTEEYWIVHQDAPRIDVFHRIPGGGLGEPTTYRGGDTLTTPLLPEFELALDALYRDLPAPAPVSRRRAGRPKPD